MSEQQKDRREEPVTTAPAREPDGPVVVAVERQAEDQFIRGYN
jgi:hypothetical protein